jgi:predicted esterase
VLAARGAYSLARPLAVGFSNGANIAAAMLLLRPEVLDGAILFRPMVPLEPSSIPDLRGIGVLIGAARHDPIATPAETERLQGLLERAGAKVRIEWVNAGHGLTSADVANAKAWLG